MAQKQTVRKPRHRTYARNRPLRAAVKQQVAESDGTYFLKLVIIVILGMFWLKFTQPLSWHGIPLGSFPVGVIIGLGGIALFEKNQTDRKIWYAVLIIVTIVSSFLPVGIVL